MDTSMRIFLNNTDTIPELPSGHTTAYKLAGHSPEYDDSSKLRVSPDHLHGCRIVRRWTAADTDVAAVRDLLVNIKTYGSFGHGAMCYYPGFAFTFGQGAAVVDVLVCLQCHWVVFHLGEKSVQVAPTAVGLTHLEKIYQTLIE